MQRTTGVPLTPGSSSLIFDAVGKKVCMLGAHLLLAASPAQEFRGTILERFAGQLQGSGGH